MPTQNLPNVSVQVCGNCISEVTVEKQFVTPFENTAKVQQQ